MTLNRYYPVALIARGFAFHFVAAALSLVALKSLILLLFGRGVWVASMADLAFFAMIIAGAASVLSWYLKRRQIS